MCSELYSGRLHAAVTYDPPGTAWCAGVPLRVKVHDVTKQVEYVGEVLDVLEAVSNLPAGGQVSVDTPTAATCRE